MSTRRLARRRGAAPVPRPPRMPQATTSAARRAGALAARFEPSAPPGALGAPLLGLPHHRGRDEQHRRHAEVAGQTQAGSLEQLMALPHEGHLGFRQGPPGSIRKRPRRRHCRTSFTAVLSSPGADAAQGRPSGLRRPGSEPRRRASAGRQHAGRGDNPRLPSTRGRGIRPSGRAEQRRHRALLLGGASRPPRRSLRPPREGSPGPQRLWRSQADRAGYRGPLMRSPSATRSSHVGSRSPDPRHPTCSSSAPQRPVPPSCTTPSSWRRACTCRP